MSVLRILRIPHGFVFLILFLGLLSFFYFSSSAQKEPKPRIQKDKKLAWTRPTRRGMVADWVMNINIIVIGQNKNNKECIEIDVDVEGVVAVDVDVDVDLDVDVDFDVEVDVEVDVDADDVVVVDVVVVVAAAVAAVATNSICCILKANGNTAPPTGSSSITMPSSS